MKRISWLLLIGGSLLEAVINFEWKQPFSVKALQIVEPLVSVEPRDEISHELQTALLALYLEEKEALGQVVAAPDRSTFCKKIGRFKHLFIEESWKDGKLFEALVIHEYSGRFIESPLVSVIIMKAFKEKKTKFLNYIEKKISNFAYLGFEAGLLLNNRGLQQQYLQKGIAVYEPFYTKDGPPLIMQVLQKNSASMMKVLLKAGVSPDETVAINGHLYTLVEIATQMGKCHAVRALSS
jgi:hypothetical protein